MPWGDDDDNGWDDDRVGYGENSTAHRWKHEWMFWLSVVFALLGIIALIGSLRPFSVARVVGAVAVLGAIPVLKRADTMRGRDLRQWCVLAVLLGVGGAALFLVSS